MTRLDCVLGSAATVRAALTQALHHADHRARLRRAARRPAPDAQRPGRPRRRERGGDGAGDAPGRRGRTTASTPSSGWPVPPPSSGSASAPPRVVAEALEVLGGNGYVEESGMPRLYRQAPLNSIWEGSGNVIALDVLRAMGRQSESLAAVTAELELARGADARYDDARQAAVRRARRPRPAAAAGPADRRAAGAVPAGLAAPAVRARRRSPTRSAPPGWAATGARSWAPCPRPARSSPRRDGLGSRRS